MKPLFIWAGGKNKMIPKYKATPGIPTNGFDTFVEPFFGGGAMTIYMYKNVPSIKRFVINDVKKEVMEIYKSVKHDHEEFCKKLDELESQYIPLDKVQRKKFYYDLRHEHAWEYEKWNKVEESAVLYFLMRTGFNGIYQLNINTNGRYGTPSGLLKEKTAVYDRDNLKEWHVFLQKADLKCGDWLEASDSYDNAFFFLDPPYRDSFTQYGSEFDDEAQIKLINFCKEKAATGNIVFYCNRDDGTDNFYETHKGSLQSEHYAVTYTAGRRKKIEDGFEAKKAIEILLHNAETKETLEEFF